jgi:3-methyl-2-oxobutanoate hydroxymethyltransferase
MTEAQKQERKKLTVPDLAARKKAGEKVVMASIPDYPSAVWAERAGIDIAAVGDSLGMVSYGFPNTLPVTIDMMIQHAQAVRRGAPSCLIMVSMTYGSYASPEIGVTNALRLMKEGGADVVKMQGGKDKAPIIKAIADAGVPVMSHVGMCPHFVHQYGGFKLQGRTAEDAMRIIEDGIAIEEAGAVGFEIEAVPRRSPRPWTTRSTSSPSASAPARELRPAAARLRPARRVRPVQAEIHQALCPDLGDRGGRAAALRRRSARWQVPRRRALLWNEARGGKGARQAHRRSHRRSHG